MHEFLHAFTHTDKGILFLIKEMFFHPGKVALEFNAGKRKKYFNPITFLLIMTAVQIYAASKTGIFTQYTEALHAFTQQVVGNAGGSAADLQEVDRQMEDADRTTVMVLENNKLITMLFIPVLSFLTWLFFRRSGHNYAENLVFNVLVFGQLMVFFVIFCLVPFLIKPSLVILWISLYFPMSWVYSLIAYRQFFKQGWGITIFKGLVLQLIYLFLVPGITMLVFDFLKK
jgi:hypothetical protein